MGHKIERVERERQAIELRKAGLSYKEIADRLGYKSAGSVWEQVQRALERTLREAGTEQIRDFEGDRLDRLQAAVWGRAVTGDIPAVNAVLRIMERRARLLGLDAPVLVQATVEHFDASTLDQEVLRLADLLRAQKASAITTTAVELSQQQETGEQDGEDSETGAWVAGVVGTTPS